MSAFLTGIASAHLVCGRYLEGLAVAERAISKTPDYSAAQRVKTVALVHLGRIEEAKLAAARLLELAPAYSVSYYLSVSPMRDHEYRETTAELLRAAGVPE
jgi:hypothetical protein